MLRRPARAASWSRQRPRTARDRQVNRCAALARGPRAALFASEVARFAGELACTAGGLGRPLCRDGTRRWLTVAHARVGDGRGPRFSTPLSRVSSTPSGSQGHALDASLNASGHTRLTASALVRSHLRCSGDPAREGVKALLATSPAVERKVGSRARGLAPATARVSRTPRRSMRATRRNRGQGPVKRPRICGHPAGR